MLSSSDPNKCSTTCGRNVHELLLQYGARPAAALEGAAEGGQPRNIEFLLHRHYDLPFRNKGEPERAAL